MIGEGAGSTMKRDVWVTALVMPAIVLPITLVIFAVIAFGLDLVHDVALWVGLLLFAAISGGAYYFARRTEEEMRAGTSEKSDS
jgi:membrane protein implicated in regulation of membrane protease activity